MELVVVGVVPIGLGFGAGYATRSEISRRRWRRRFVG